MPELVNMDNDYLSSLKEARRESFNEQQRAMGLPTYERDPTGRLRPQAPGGLLAGLKEVPGQVIGGVAQAALNIPILGEMLTEFGIKQLTDDETDRFIEDLGKRFRQKLTVRPEAETFLGKAVGELSEFIGSAAVPAGLLGQAAKVPKLAKVGQQIVEKVGAKGAKTLETAGVFGTAEALKSSKELPEDLTVGGFLERTGLSTALGSTLGLASTISAPLKLGGKEILTANKTRLLGEYAALTGTIPALEGRLPTKEEGIYGALLLGGFKVMNLGLAKLAAKQGKPVEQVREEVKKEAETTGEEPSGIVFKNLRGPESTKAAEEALASIGGLRAPGEAFILGGPPKESSVGRIIQPIVVSGIKISPKPKAEDPLGVPVKDLVNNALKELEKREPKERTEIESKPEIIRISQGEVIIPPAVTYAEAKAKLEAFSKELESSGLGIPERLREPRTEPSPAIPIIQPEGVISGERISPAIEGKPSQPEPSTTGSGAKTLQAEAGEAQPVKPIEAELRRLEIERNDIEKQIRKGVQGRAKEFYGEVYGTEPPQDIFDRIRGVARSIRIDESLRTRLHKDELQRLKGVAMGRKVPITTDPNAQAIDEIADALKMSANDLVEKMILAKPKVKIPVELENQARGEFKATTTGSALHKRLDEIEQRLERIAIESEPTLEFSQGLKKLKDIEALENPRIVEALGLWQRLKNLRQEAKQGIDNSKEQETIIKQIKDITNSDPEVRNEVRAAGFEGGFASEGSEKQFINIEHFVGTPEGKSFVESRLNNPDVIRTFVERQKTISEKETATEGAKIPAEKIILKITGAKDKVVLNSQEASRAQMIFEELARVGADFEAKATAEPDNAKLLTQYQNFTGLFDRYLVNYGTIRSEMGRAFQTLQAKERVIIENFQSKTQEIMWGDRPMTFEDYRKVFKTLDQKEIEKLMAKAIKQPSIFFELWINGLLSNPATHSINFLSNASVLPLSLVERFLAPYMVYVKELPILGKYVGEGTGVVPGEAGAMFNGMMNGLSGALSLAKKALTEGSAVSKVEQTGKAITAEKFGLDSSTSIGHTLDVLGGIVRLPGHFLMAADDFFKAINGRMGQYALAHRKAYTEGLRESKALSKRVNELLESPDFTKSVQNEIRSFGEYQTFTNDPGKIATSLLGLATDYPAFRVVLPFIRTPANIFTYTFERLGPLALVQSHVRADIMAGGARRDLALARMAIGSTVMGLVVWLAKAGYITGSGPHDDNLKKTWRDAGYQPNSIKVGDTWYSFIRSEPLGTLMGMAGDLAQMGGYFGEPTIGKVAMAMALSIKDKVLSKTWLTGITSIVEAIQSPDQKAHTYMKSLGKSLIPAGFGQVERFLDPTVRETETILDAMKERVPGYSTSLPPKLNMWGEPVIIENPDVFGLINPIYISTDKNNLAAKEMLRLKIGIQMPERSIAGPPTSRFDPLRPETLKHGVTLNPQQYHRLVQLSGEGLREEITNLIDNPFYQRQTDAMKEEMIRKIIRDKREDAREALLAEDLDLRFAVEERKFSRARALVAE